MDPAGVCNASLDRFLALMSGTPKFTNEVINQIKPS